VSTEPYVPIYNNKSYRANSSNCANDTNGTDCSNCSSDLQNKKLMSRVPVQMIQLLVVTLLLFSVNLCVSNLVNCWILMMVMTGNSATAATTSGRDCWHSWDCRNSWYSRDVGTDVGDTGDDATSPGCNSPDRPYCASCTNGSDNPNCSLNPDCVINPKCAHCYHCSTLVFQQFQLTVNRTFLST
jgi:hypothetical protein